MDCISCGAELDDSARFCTRCGALHHGAGARAELVRDDVYASFWRRGAAAVIDGLISLAVLWPMAWLAYVRVNNAWVMFAIVLLVNQITRFLIVVTYFALFEASPMRATPGKYLLGIRVVDDNGDRVTWPQAYGREFLKMLSGVLFMIGLFMIAFTKRRQGFHDQLANTRVVYRTTEERIVMADPVAPSPHPASVIGAFLVSITVFLFSVGAHVTGGAPVGEYASRYLQAYRYQHSSQREQQIERLAKAEVYDLKIATAQAVEAVFDYRDTHDDWPATLAATRFHNPAPTTTRVAYDAQLKQVTAFARRAPMAGKLLQRQIAGRGAIEHSYHTTCISPDIDADLLPRGCTRPQAN